MKRLFASFVAVLALALLGACAALSVPKPKTFEDQIAVALTTNAKVRQAAAILLVGGKLSKADAQNVQDQADTARRGIDLARAIHGTDLPGAQTKLATSVSILKALDAYLATKGAP